MRLNDTLNEYWLIASEALRNPRDLSMATPTSWNIIRQLAALTPLGTKRVLEIGPGTGRLPHMLLASGRIDDKGLVGVIEMNMRFVEHMEKKFGNNPRVDIVKGRAEDLRHHHKELFGNEKVDRIYMSIPLSLMTEDQRQEILRASHEILADHGELIVYIVRDITASLRGVFNDVVTNNFYGNILPPLSYRVHRARKNPTVSAMNGHPMNGSASIKNGFYSSS